MVAGTEQFCTILPLHINAWAGSMLDVDLEWAPRAGQASGCGFDRRPGVAILELLRAEVAQRGM
jgi:hypothetical protein